MDSQKPAPTVSYDKAFQQIKELDRLYVKASQSQDPFDWEEYHSKVREFEKENSMSRLPKTESEFKTKIRSILGAK